MSGSGNRDDWRTPPDLLAEIYSRWHLDFDPCPFPRPDGYDGLAVPWHGRAYVNPPYSSEMRIWIAKAIEELKAGRCEVAVFLIHSRTDTQVFHESIFPNASELWFLRGRVKFIPPDDRPAESSPFPSLITVLVPNPDGRLLVGSWDVNGTRRKSRPTEPKVQLCRICGQIHAMGVLCP